MSDIHLRKRGALAGESEDLESTGDLELELDDEGTSRTTATMRTGRRRSLLAKWVLVAVTAACVGLWVFGSLPNLGFLGRQVSWQAVPAKDSNVQVNYTADRPKQEAIVAAFKDAWRSYARDAIGKDEYHPLSKTGTNLSPAGGIGYFIIDSLDTMLLMGSDLSYEYQSARSWIQDHLTFDRDGKHNTFETTIRVLGGLLSAYHLSGNDPLYLEKAKDLGERMLGVFDTPSGLALPMVNLHEKKGVGEEYQKWLVSTAEAATLQLEFKYLAHLTDNDEYWVKAEKVMKVIKDALVNIESGLAPIYMNAEQGDFITSEIRLGSRGDSFYEYLLKQYLQTNRTEEVYLEMYENTMDSIRANLVRKGINKHSTYTVELLPQRVNKGEMSWKVSPKQDHLVCFLAGSLMLGAVRSRAFVDQVSVPPKAEELSDAGKAEWALGYELLETCVDTYDSPTGLSAEIVHFYVGDDGRNWSENRGKDWYVKGMENPHSGPSYDARYILRPETVESLFIAFRLTGDHRYRDIGWKIFQSIEKHCKVESGGYASILDVMNANNPQKEDKMETFFMGETLKYLWLLFADESVLPLDEFVFNTEAHPLPVFHPSLRTGFS